MTTSPTVRRATPDDAPALVDLREEMIASVWKEPVPDNGWRESCERMYREKLTAGSTEWAAYVVDDADGVPVSGVVGWVHEHPPSPNNVSGRPGYVASMSTMPSARGRGYGRAVFAALMQWFESIGVSRVDLLASDMGEALYADFGFTVSPSKPMSWVKQP